MYNVHRIRGSIALCQYVLNAGQLHDCTHRATGDHASTFRGWLHVDLGSTVTRLHRILQCVTVKRYGNHVAASSFHCLLDGERHFARLATTEANAAIAITYRSQGCETENTTALHYFGNAVYLDQLLLQTFLVLF